MHPKTQKLISSLPSKGGFGSKIKQIIFRGSENNLLPMKVANELSIQRNNSLKNAYEGETAIILTCGPSITEVCSNGFLEFISDKLVICVKQAHEVKPEVTDIHLYNTVRLKRYDYPASTLRISVERFFKKLTSIHVILTTQ